MIDVFGTLELADSVPDLGRTITDVTLLYRLKSAGKPDIAAMDKGGTLEPAVAAAMRLTALIDKLLRDSEQRPHVVALLASLL